MKQEIKKFPPFNQIFYQLVAMKTLWVLMETSKSSNNSFGFELLKAISYMVQNEYKVFF